MTAYVVLRLAQSNPAILDETVVFSRRADRTRGSTAAIREGESLSVSELLYGLLLPSGNDASVAFAEHFGRHFPGDPAQKGTSDTDPLILFVAEMNRTAKHLRMKNTVYRNPHGLDDDEHLSSAEDLTKLAWHALSLPRFRQYVSTRERGCTVTGPGGYTRNLLWKNTNRLLAREGFRGVKTGTTDAAGACLISVQQQGTRELIVVVLGSTSSTGRYVDTRNLYRWAWKNVRPNSGDN